MCSLMLKDTDCIPPSTMLVVEDKTANEIARAMIESGQQKEPFYIFDFDETYKYVKKFRDILPRVQVFYAMKSNDYSMMVKLAIALGLGFDCASPGEINTIREHNVHPTSIIYAAPMKTPDQMIFARKSGVRHTTFDSSCELNRLKQYWPDARLLIRVKLESDSVYKLNDKFGCNFGEAIDLLEEAAHIGMVVIGVAFHVGSGCFSKQSYTEGLCLARALFDHEAGAGRRMSLLDIGGGFFDDNTDRFEQAAYLINRGLEKWFPDPDIQIIAEPGRYICESAFTLYSSIRDIRSVEDSGKVINMVYLNDGINGSLRSIETWHTKDIFKATKDITRTEDIPQNTIIWGPTIDDRDFLGPLKLTECTTQDWLVFNQQGAYSLSFETEFCCRKGILTRSIVSKQLWSMIKNKPIFSSDAFVMDSDAAPCLPSTLAPVLPDGKYLQSPRSTIIE